MPLIILSVLIQIAFVLHVLKTGRNERWIYLVMFIPVAGAAAYFIMEIMPDLMAGPGGRKARKSAGKILNPNKDLNAASHDLQVADTVQNNQRLAEELMEQSRYDQAAGLLEKCLTGLNQYNPQIMAALATCQFEQGLHSTARDTLDTLIKENPDFKSQDSHLIYARSLEQQGDIAGASAEYDALVGYYTGPEPSYHYAMMLKAHGNTEKAERLLVSLA